MCFLFFFSSSVFVNGVGGEFTYDTPRVCVCVCVCVCGEVCTTSCLVLFCAENLSIIFSKLYYSFSA